MTTPEEYHNNRRARAEAFTAQAKKDAADLRANPERYTICDAIALVGLDEAIALHKAGRLSP